MVVAYGANRNPATLSIKLLNCTCPLATMLPTRTEGHTLRR